MVESRAEKEKDRNSLSLEVLLGLASGTAHSKIAMGVNLVPRSARIVATILLEWRGCF